MILTALSCVGVVMYCKAAWAVKPLPAVMTDVFPCLLVVTVLRVYRARRFGWRGSAPSVWSPPETGGGYGRRR